MQHRDQIRGGFAGQYALDQILVGCVALGLQFEWADVPVQLVVLDARDERATLKTSIGGRPVERASLQAVAEMVATEP